MNTLDSIYQRRAVKYFDPEHVVPKETLSKLLDAVRQCPTSFNIQNWRLVLVEDKNLRSEIRKAAWDQAQITDASLLFIICADVKAWNKSPERYWSNAPEAVQNILVPMIKPFYEGKEQLQRDEAMRSVGLCAQTLMLAAKDLDYDSCPMIGFDSNKVSELIKLPSDHAIGMIVVVGKGTKPAHQKGGFIPMEEAVIKDTF